MGNVALTQAVKGLSLPEHVVRSVLFDYLEFLKERQLTKHEALEARLGTEAGLHDRLYFEAQGSMLAATLMMTLESGVDTAELFDEVYGRQVDEDLLAMRKELVSRAVNQAKDAIALAGLAMSLVKERKAHFCQE
jgi:hypothetical protein